MTYSGICAIQPNPALLDCGKGIIMKGKKYGIKYGILMALIVLCSVWIWGCSGNSGGTYEARTDKRKDTDNTEEMRTADKPAENTFVIENYGVKVTFGSDWEKLDDHPFDLQCGNQNAYASIFCYEKIDLASGQEPMDIFQMQIEDVFSRRENVELFEEGKVREADGKIITTFIYMAEKDGVKNAYHCSLVEFQETDEKFVWIMFTSVPSYIMNNMESWDEILDSIQISNKMV